MTDAFSPNSVKPPQTERPLCETAANRGNVGKRRKPKSFPSSLRKRKTSP